MNRREQIRDALVNGREPHVVIQRVIAWARKHAAKSWDTSAIVQLVNIYKLRILDARAQVSELHTGSTIHSPGDADVRILQTWSCDWDEKMLDIPTI